ncbi:MAG: glucose-6-phosphate dehydrogenase assembly protein OpcA [Isosphaeraceae bacterium]
MPDVMTDTFLEGQGIPVDLHEIETEMVKLWGPAAQQVGGPEVENPHVTRIALANLVVACLDEDGEWLGRVMETVIARFPCRAIVVVGSKDPGRRVAAEVSALCHLPAPGLPQVCSERIVLRAGPNALDLLPGAVRPLLEAELPVVLWWIGDPRPHEGLFRDLAGECSRLILDLPDPGADVEAVRMGLDPSVCPFSRDAAWFGLTRWRELVAQFFDPSCAVNALERIDSVQIAAIAPEPGRPPRIAIWLAAWMAGQLGWKPQGRPVRSSAPSESTLDAEFLGPSGTIRVRIATGPAGAAPAPEPRVMGVTITARGSDGRARETFQLVRPSADSPAVRVDAETTDLCRLPRLVEAPELDAAHRVGAALESSRIDPPFHKALPIALWLLEDRA